MPAAGDNAQLNYKCRTCGRVCNYAAAFAHKYAYKHDISGNKHYVTSEPRSPKLKGGPGHGPNAVPKPPQPRSYNALRGKGLWRCPVCSKEISSRGGVYSHIRLTSHGPTFKHYTLLSGGVSHGKTSKTTHQSRNASEQASGPSHNDHSGASGPTNQPPDTLIAYLFGKVEESLRTWAEGAGVPAAPVATRVGELLQRSAGRGLLGSKHRLPGL
jgi:hypothetical protein